LTDLLKNTLPDNDDYAALTGMTIFLFALFTAFNYCLIIDRMPARVI